MHVAIHTCPGALYFCYSCSRLKFARAVNRSRCTSQVLNWPCIEMYSWLHFGGATVACRCTYLSWCSLLLLLLFATKVCSDCEPVSLHLSSFELALYRDALMAPFWGRYGCMSPYLVVMVMFNFNSLQPLLALVVHQPLGLRFLKYTGIPKSSMLAWDIP